MHKILVANRGEIAVRIFKTCREMQIGTVAVYSEADQDALHVREADEAFCIGPPPAVESYLSASQIIAAAKASEANAIHPGYGFLSESSEFARAVEEAGLIWVGPPARAMEAMASKIAARNIAVRHKVPVVAGLTLDADAALSELAEFESLSMPLLIKAAAGGGGIGMREVHDLDNLAEAVSEARNQAQRQFGDTALLVEELLAEARHVEVQVIGDQHGNLIHLFERDCSAQRRRQKLIEEAPASQLSDTTRAGLHAAALRLSAAVKYHGAGTVEFIVKGESFYFLEMNTRLQVEHGVTEAVTGLDLVKMQIDVAMGKQLELEQQDVSCSGHAIEARVYAEDPAAGFAPSVGAIDQFHHANPASIRLDSGVTTGSNVSRHYDGLLCKLIAHGEDREAATNKLAKALPALCIAGVQTNQRFLRSLLNSSPWQSGTIDISFAEAHLHQESCELQPDRHALVTALIAATIWQFRMSPPPADLRPWPGGFTFDRTAHWKCEGEHLTVLWRWLSADRFAFPDLDSTACLVADGSQGGWVISINDQRTPFRIEQQAGTVFVWSPTTGSVLLQPKLSKGDTHESGNPNVCASPGPGQVLRVLVEPGQSVRAGDALMVLESMKMETPLLAARDGVIASVEVEDGALVETGRILIRLALGQEERT